jgi:hypothetical protein
VTEPEPVVKFFDMAKTAIIAEGYEDEIKYVQNRFFKDIAVDEFAEEATFVLLISSGLKEQVARKNYDAFMNCKNNRPSEDPYPLIHNRRQREAIRNIWTNKASILQQIKDQPTDADKIEFLNTLPQIGKIMKYHFARNLGIDTIKPDLWMDRLAEIFDFKNPFEMCEAIRKQRPELRIGTIDVILWRYCNLFGLARVGQKTLSGAGP